MQDALVFIDKPIDNENLLILSTCDSANRNDRRILLVKYKERYTLHRQFKDAMAASSKFNLFNTIIRESQAINNAKKANKDIFSKEYSKANAVKDYAAFVDELLERIKVKKPTK